MILVCNPNNPTGAVLDEEEMDAVVAAARRVGAWIVADEIYRGAELAGDALTPTFFGRYERVVGHRRPVQGLRPARSAHRMGRRPPRPHQEDLDPPRLHDPDAGDALRPSGRRGHRARTARADPGAHPRHRAPAVAAARRLAAAATRTCCEWAPPRAGAIALARYRLPVGSTALVDRIRREQSVLLVPGDMLGAGRSLRFGFGYDIDHTLAGLARVDRVIAPRRSTA